MIQIPQTYGGALIYGKGFIYPNDFTLQGYYDLICLDCKNSWAELKKALLELNLENHLKNSIKVEDFQDKVKEGILSAYKDSLK